MARKDVALAQHLRAHMTGVELRVWSRLRMSQLGWKFRRQHPIGPYVADFACLAKRLLVEIDGPSHDPGDDTEARRTAYLEARGFRVIRFTADEVDQSLDAVVEAIWMELGSPSPPP